MAESNGLATALRLLGAAGAAADGAGDSQDELFDEFATDTPLVPARGVSGARGGRPKGARNKSTDEWVKLFLASHRSPLAVLGEIADAPLEDLVDELQRMADKSPLVRTDKDGVVERTALRISPLDVLKLKRDAAVALLPYLHKAQPKALEIESRPRGLMVLAEFEDVTDAAGAPADDTHGLPLADVAE